MLLYLCSLPYTSRRLFHKGEISVYTRMQMEREKMETKAASGIVLREIPRTPEMPPKTHQPPPKKKRTGLYIGVVLTVVIGVIAIVYLASQLASLPGLTEPFTPAKSVHNIDYFVVLEKGETLQVQFALMSQDLDFVSTDGTVKLAISDEATNQIVYETEFAIQKSDFQYYETLLGKTVLAYLWSIQLSDVEKGFSHGTAKLTFTASDGKSCSDTSDYVSIPKYTEEEANQMFENEYISSATTVDKFLTAEDFQITVMKIGMFSRYTYSDFERTFRVDLKVKNTGSGTKSFSVYDTALITATGLQYERSYYGTFESGDISAGATKEGYLLFDDVPETANIAKLVIDEIYIFDFEKDETYTLMEMYENMYLQSAITVQQTITKEDFAITLVKVGHFTHLKYDTWGDEVTQFRVELKVRSIASEPEYIWESDIVVLDNLGNQYDHEYGGTLELGEIHPGVTREGYVLFPELDENASGITVTMTDTTYPEDIVYEFNVYL